MGIESSCFVKAEARAGGVVPDVFVELFHQSNSFLLVCFHIFGLERVEFFGCDPVAFRI